MAKDEPVTSAPSLTADELLLKRKTTTPEGKAFSAISQMQPSEASNPTPAGHHTTTRSINDLRFSKTPDTQIQTRYPFQFAQPAKSPHYLTLGNCGPNDGLGYQLIFVIQYISFALQNDLTIIWDPAITRTNHHSESGAEILKGLGWGDLYAISTESANDVVSKKQLEVVEFADSLVCSVAEQFGQPGVDCFSKLVADTRAANGDKPTLFRETTDCPIWCAYCI